MFRPAPALLTTLLAFTSLAAQEPHSLMMQARGLQRRTGGDDPEKAASLYRKVIAALPDSAEAHLRLSEALAECGDLEGALPPAIRATELSPNHAEAWANLGVLQFFKGRTDPKAWDKALVALEKASILLPKDIDLLMRLGEVAETRKKDQLAMETWLRLGRLRPQATIQGRDLTDIAFERAAILGGKIGHMEGRRESLLALCKRPEPDARHLRMLEELAREQVERGFLAFAEESFRLLSKNFPNEPAVFENIALIQLQTGRFEEALPTLESANQLRKTPGATYYTAYCLMNLGRIPEAEARLREFLAQGPQPQDPKAGTPRDLTADARELLGTALLLSGRPAECLAWIQTLPEAAQTDAILSLKVQCLIQTEAWRKAREALKEGMKQFPGRRIFALAALLPEKALFGGIFSGKESRQTLQQLDLEYLAGIWSDFRQWKQALEAVKAARSAAPVRGAELLLLQATALENLGRPEEAMATLREAQKLAPDHATVQNNLGYMLLERSGDLNEAATLIQASMAKEPKNGSTRDSWGWVLYKQGKVKEAEEALRQAVELSPLSPEIRRHFGEVLLHLGRHEEALEQWERALAYVFPGRADLEKKAKALRLEVAKRRAKAPEPTADPDPDPHDDEDERP